MPARPVPRSCVPRGARPRAALPAARTLRLVRAPSPAASQGAPGAIRGAAGDGGASEGAGQRRRAASVAAGGEGAGDGMRGALPGRAGSRRGRGAGEARSCESSAWQGVTASPLFWDSRYARRFLVEKSVCEPKAGVGSCGMCSAGGAAAFPRRAGEGVWACSGKFSGSYFTTCISQLQELSRGAQLLGSAPSQLSLSLSLMLKSTLLPGMCTVIVAGCFPTPTNSFRHSLNYLKMTGAYKAGFLLLCYSVGNPKLHGSCFSPGSCNTLIFSLQFVLTLKDKNLQLFSLLTRGKKKVF